MVQKVYYLSISSSHPGQLSLLPLAGQKMSTSQKVPESLRGESLATKCYKNL